MLHEVAGTAHHLLLHAGHLSAAAAATWVTLNSATRTCPVNALPPLPPAPTPSPGIIEAASSCRCDSPISASHSTLPGVVAWAPPKRQLQTVRVNRGGEVPGYGGAYLHECARVHQAGQLTHDGYMLASIPLGSTELTEVLHKVLQHHTTYAMKTRRQGVKSRAQSLACCVTTAWQRHVELGSWYLVKLCLSRLKYVCSHRPV